MSGGKISPEQYAALTEGCGFVDLGDRTRIMLTGNDRAAFLHNMCTNDVKNREPGDVTEAFFCDVRGKVIGHALLAMLPEGIVLESAPGQAETLMTHLDRYVIREDVTLQDHGQSWGELLVGGGGSGELLGAWLDDPSIVTQRRCRQLQREPQALVLIPLPWHRSAWLLLSPRSVLAEASRHFAERGAVACDLQTYHALRIEAGMPDYGVDITRDNLPQEVGRDRQAISFVKGCYLGQETVARIDALGHVNRLLVACKFLDSTLPSTGTELQRDGKVVGRVTSATFSPSLDGPLALAYVRRGNEQTGVRLDSPCGPAEVVAFPR